MLLMLLLSFTSIANSKTKDENYRDAITELKTCNDLLIQEKQRWETIHNNPVTDKWEVTKDTTNDNMVIKVTIDDNVKNIINDQPIQRSYTLSPVDNRFLKPFDSILGACFVTSDGFRPYLGIGYRPYQQIKKYLGYSFPDEIGISIGTTCYSLDTTIYYMPKQIPNSIIFIGSGVTIKGEPLALLGIGLVF